MLELKKYIKMVHIFLLCHNEEVLIPHTIAYYRRCFSNCNITVYDNESTDRSVEIAQNLGCHVISFSTDNIQNEFVQQKIKDQCWKHIQDDWVLVPDMDEWICVTDTDLEHEKAQGICILRTRGYDMVAESQKSDLSDLDLHTCNVGVPDSHLNKPICFYRFPYLRDMNFTYGAHKCFPIIESGSMALKYSLYPYVIKHMSLLGLPFLIDKMTRRYERTEIMRKYGLDSHYTQNIEHIHELYTKAVKDSVHI